MKIKHFTLLLLINIIGFRLQAQQTGGFSTPPEDHARYIATQLNETGRKQFDQALAGAEKGDAAAEFELGGYYFFGRLGVTNDAVEALGWYRKAAEQGYSLAQVTLGICYGEGKGVETNYTEAFKWFSMAAEKNDSNGQLNLGFCYAKGFGVEHDERKAAYWYRKAAEQNNASGQYCLGVAYYDGSGVPKDYIEARKWWILASDQGQQDAKRNLAIVEKKLTFDEAVESQFRAAEFRKGIGTNHMEKM